VDAVGVVAELLPKIEAPTLVSHCRNDARVPFKNGLELAAGIPKARFVPRESNNHLVLEQEKAWSRILSEVSKFLGSNPA